MNTQTPGIQTSILAITHAAEISFPSRNLNLQELHELFTTHLRETISAKGFQRIAGVNLTTNAVKKGTDNEFETTRFSVNLKPAAGSKYASNGHKKAAKRMANRKPNLFTNFKVDLTSNTVKFGYDNRFNLADLLVQAVAKALVMVLIELKNAGQIQNLEFNCNGGNKTKYTQAVWNYQTNQIVNNAQTLQGTQTQNLNAPVNPTGGVQVSGHGLPATAIPMLLVNVGGKCLLVPQGQVIGQSLTPIQVDQKTIEALGLPVQAAH